MKFKVPSDKLRDRKTKKNGMLRISSYPLHSSVTGVLPSQTDPFSAAPGLCPDRQDLLQQEPNEGGDEVLQLVCNKFPEELPPGGAREGSRASVVFTIELIHSLGFP